MLYLKQSTAGQSVLLGPFIDNTDGNTAETGLTIANTDIRLSKNGANIVAKNSGGGTHDELGYYAVTLDATDTDTVGRLQVAVHITADALPVYHEYQVLEEAIYDAMFLAAATGFDGNGRVSVASFAANAITAAAINTNALTAAKIAANAITSSQIAANAIGSSQLATDAISATQIAANAITAAKIAATALDGKGDWNIGKTGYDLDADQSGVTIGALNALATNAVNAASIAADAVTKLRALPKKNTALANFPFAMFDSTTQVPLAGLTVTATRSIDGAAFAATANSVVEIAFGAYQIDLAAGDLNGDTVILRFTATGANDQLISIVPQS